MALAVIGGLIFSTILSLVFVPAMFMVMDDLGALCWRFGQKLLVSSGETRKPATDRIITTSRRPRARPRCPRRCRLRRSEGRSRDAVVARMSAAISGNT